MTVFYSLAFAVAVVAYAVWCVWTAWPRRAVPVAPPAVELLEAPSGWPSVWPIERPVAPVRVETPELSDELIEHVLTVHYRQLLASPDMQRVVRKMLAVCSGGIRRYTLAGRVVPAYDCVIRLNHPPVNLSSPPRRTNHPGGTK